MEAFLDALVDTLEFFPKGLIYVVLGLAVLFIAKVVQDLITRYSINQQVTGENNAALGLSLAGVLPRRRLRVRRCPVPAPLGDT